MTKPIPPARKAALDALQDCLGRSRDLQAALDDSLRAASLTDRDAGLATQLAYGYLRYKGRLEFILSTLLNAPERVSPLARLVLGLAAYEILHLEKIPAYASVDWAVERLKADNPGQAKLANAVLRRLDRERAQYENESFYRRGASTEQALGRRYSCPEWIVSLWLDAYGEEDAQRLLAASLDEPPMGLRVNLARTGGAALFDELAAHPDCLLADAPTLAFRSGARLDDVDLPGLRLDGRLSRQSAASQQALLALLPRETANPGFGPVWDACAGRGGKTSLLLERGLKPVLASDPNKTRLTGLPAELARLGLDDCLPVIARADREPPVRRRLPLVLIDAPCSGLGVLSRRPDAKWKRTPEDVADLLTLQSSILHHASDAVAPGGAMVYLTCTLNPRENLRRVEFFLGKHPAFSMERVWSTPHDSPLKEFFWGALLRRE